MVDRSELYPGAVVTVRARLSMSTACITAECAMVIFDGPYDSGDHATVPIAAIITVEPRPLAVGDRVRRDLRDGGGVLLGEILHIHGDHAWVDYGSFNALDAIDDLTPARLPEGSAP